MGVDCIVEVVLFSASSKARRGTESNRSCSDIDDANNLFWLSMGTIRNPDSENLFVDNYDLLQYSP